MKLCWENLDKLRLTRNGNLRASQPNGGGNMYVYVDECKNCGNPFLAIKVVKNGITVIDEYCCHACSMIGKTHTLETLEKMSKTHTGKIFSTTHKDNLSRAKTGKNNPAYKGDVIKNNLPLYNTYASHLCLYEDVGLTVVSGIRLLQVRCHNSDCRKWFIPKQTLVRSRMAAINESGGRNLYCSDECKNTCSTFNRTKYFKGQTLAQTERPYTKEQYELYRQVVLERENYICEYCETEATEVHHEKSQKTDPMFAVDPDYGHAVCKACHYKYGHKTGTDCSTDRLAKKIC